MSKLADALDMAIKKSEACKDGGGFVIGEREFGAYLKNQEWESFVRQMQDVYPAAFEEYSDGSGDELGHRYIRGKLYPPKMASFGSSSRMIYLLARDIGGFSFEKKLPTTIGGTANLDGFFESEDEYVFVEAKCREPYSPKNTKIRLDYEDFYRYITKSKKTMLRCEISHIDSEKRAMTVDFCYGDKRILFFDTKQMLSHLLGIATAVLNGEIKQKKIRFVYLLFNPKVLEFGDAEEGEKVCEVYERVCEECNALDFSELFSCALEYLKERRKFGAMPAEKNAHLFKKFEFVLCDQVKFRETIHSRQR